MNGIKEYKKFIFNKLSFFRIKFFLQFRKNFLISVKKIKI